MHTDLTPTDELLVLGARTVLSAELVQQAYTLLAHPIDWQTFLHRAECHRVAPLLHKTLPQLGQEVVPAAVREALARSSYAWAARNLHLFSALRQVLTALQAAGVPVIVLKGAALAETVYGSLALRPMSDLDLLVHRDHLPSVARALDREGYALPPHLLAPAYYQHNHFHLPFRHNRQEVLLEVHWHLKEDLGVQQPDLAEIWRGAVQVRVAGVDTLVMGLDDLLLYLCLHLQKHGYYNRYLRTQPGAAAYILRGPGANRLLWFCDLWTVLQRHHQELDWPHFVDKARRWGIEEAVYCGLDLLGRLFGPSPAVPVLTMLRPPRLRWYEPGLYRHIINLESSVSEAHGLRRWYGQRLLGLQAQLQLRPVRFFTLLDHLFPTRQAIARKYRATDLAVPLYYVVHVLRTVARSSLGVLWLAYYTARKGVVRRQRAARHEKE